ncbi:HK97 gp10 family phage protein [Devosia sp. MC532]|uniref:HK97 gp10 family phage protein n=1 Tax=Devosia sp. MC532 TaxID=2799788 RepID=UPI0032C041ED
MAYSAQVKRLMGRIEGIPDAIRADIKPSIAKSADELAGMMGHLALLSRDTGALIDSITVTLPGGTTPAYSQPGGERVAHDLEAIVTVGNQDVRYPHLVEYGTADAPAQPYFWPAVRTLQKRINNRINRAMRKAIKTHWNTP